MPYYIAKEREGCKSGWAVIDEAGEMLGCHTTKESAIDQAVAVSLATDEEFVGERAAVGYLKPGDYVTWDVTNPEFLAEVFMVSGEVAVLEIYELEDGIYSSTEKLMIFNILKLTVVPRPEFLAEKLPDVSADDVVEDSVPVEDLSRDKVWADVAKGIVAKLEPQTERDSMNTDTRAKWADVAVAIVNRLEGRSTPKHEERVNVIDLEVRETGDGMTFEGYAAVFNAESEDLGGFREFIAPGAFKRSLQSRNEVKLLWNHDAGEPLASVRGGTLKLIEDARGLKVEARLANTSRGRDVAELIRSKTVDSMSFGFSVIKDTWNNDGNVRTLNAVRLFEISLVSFPAYQATAGTVSVRSAQTIDADQLADALFKLESGEELDPTAASLITDVVAKLTKTEEVQEVQGDILALKKKKLDLLMKGL